MIHIVHVTSAHSRKDTRIFLKECRSLVENGHRVTLLVADGLPDEFSDGVTILSVRKAKSRLVRFIFTPFILLGKLKTLDADVCHFHDPELLFLALRLKTAGKKIVFDFHEDVALQILSKAYINKRFRRFISGVYSIFERFAVRKFDLVIAATPTIRDKLSKINSNVITVNNYPLLGELLSRSGQRNAEPCVVYVGGITQIRGIRQMLEALEYCTSNVVLCLAGKFSPEHLRDDLVDLPGWKKVKELGFLRRDQVGELLAKASAGLVLFLPEPNHLYSQPNKLFEYMSAGVPVIASNFPAWKSVVENRKCGLCVNPEDPHDIAKAIDWIVDHPAEASAMGSRGVTAVNEEFNWGMESKKLFLGYQSIAKK